MPSFRRAERFKHISTRVSVLKRKAFGLPTLRCAVLSAIKLVAAIVVVALIGFTVVHLTNGFGFGESLGASFRDARLAITCPTKPKLLWDFVDRPAWENRLLTLGSMLAGPGKGDMYRELCKLGTWPE